MRRNVIVLTSGLTGSSVLTALIARAGYWTGGSTHKKSDYDTFESKELIRLNQCLIKEAGFEGDYLVDFSSKTTERLTALHKKIDLDPYQSFLGQCNENLPWIWKDPRLWMTIRFWNKLGLNNCTFIILTRSLIQVWISALLRGQIRTYRHSSLYEKRIEQSFVDFLQKNGLPYIHLRYEDLIIRPAREVARLNRHLDTNLTVDDLRAVYHKPLHKNPRNSALNHMKAILIYFKHYSRRLDIAAEAK
jgi:hypothetical protein